MNAEIINSTHYQSVSCSAIGGRPTAQINWLVSGLPASNDPFTVNVRNTAHSNGTSTLSSILRFPTQLQDEDSVTCEVRHPSLQSPKYTKARVETYGTLTLKAMCVSAAVFLHLCCKKLPYCTASTYSFVIIHHDSAGTQSEQ